MSPGEWRKHDLNRRKALFKRSKLQRAIWTWRNGVYPNRRLLKHLSAWRLMFDTLAITVSIRNAWLILKAWANSEQRDFSSQFGLHPPKLLGLKWTSALCGVPSRLMSRLKYRSVVNQMVIPGGLHAVFRLNGRYGELLPQISMVLEKWLLRRVSSSAQRLLMCVYHQNHFSRQWRSVWTRFLCSGRFY